MLAVWNSEPGGLTSLLLTGLQFFVLEGLTKILRQNCWIVRLLIADQLFLKYNVPESFFKTTKITKFFTKITKV